MWGGWWVCTGLEELDAGGWRVSGPSAAGEHAEFVLQSGGPTEQVLVCVLLPGVQETELCNDGEAALLDCFPARAIGKFWV